MHNRLVCLEELEVDQDRLVFYEENQAVVLWGVNIQNPVDADPAVFMAENQDELGWDADHDHLSKFLHAMLFWQAVNGGMAYGGIGTAISEDLEAISDDWEVVDLGGDSVLWGNRRGCATARLCSLSATILICRCMAAAGRGRTF